MSEQPGAAHEATLALPFEGEGRLRKAQRTLAGRVRSLAATVAWRGVFLFMDVKLRLNRPFRRLIYRPAVAGGLAADGSIADDWRARIVVEGRDGSFAVHAIIGGGRVRQGGGRLDSPDLVLSFRDADTARAMLTRPPSEMLEMLLRSELVFTGNMSHASRLGYVLSALAPAKGAKAAGPRRTVALPAPRRSSPMAPCDAVKHLPDPGLSALTLDDFPRLHRLVQDFFELTPELCTERPRLYTRWLREHGFETDAQGRPWNPILRQAGAFHHLMTHRAPLIRQGCLLAGTTTAKDVGVVVYPECGGLVLWSELRTVAARTKNPYRLTTEDERILNEEVNPFWMDRNVREYTRRLHGNPLSMRLDERFALYFQWKTQGVSHTIPDFELVLRRGLRVLADEAQAAAAQAVSDEPRRAFYEAVALSLCGVLAYAEALSRKAAQQAASETDAVRRAELQELARICARVPAGPASTLHEAMQSLWTVLVACHMESSNTGFSIGRLDLWLQPFFEADAAKLPPGDTAAKDAFIRRTVELAGCLLLRCTDHLPQVADLGNKLFGGASSVQAVTLGGVDAEGRNAVADMTFVFLKAEEMLGLRDPNFNARYHEGVNSQAYLRRLCEVNLNTGATPSIHGDRAIIEVLQQRGMSLPHARDWSATGCVEPTSCGRDYGNTNCGMFNLVAPLDMALHDGWHPLLGEQVGPHSGSPAALDTFEKFLGAYFAQLDFLSGQALQGNNWLGDVHKLVRPVPFLSAIIEGPMQQGVDLSDGGALYNSSGLGIVGLVDVVDSLVAVRVAVYEEKRVTLPELVRALDADFVGHETLAARLANRVPKFGSGHALPAELVRVVMAHVDDFFHAHPHYRGGYYKPGYWSMSNHVAFGLLTGALPSGRRRGAPFTPGCTPAPVRGVGLASQLHDVASLDGRRAGNSLAFNVKVVPAPQDSPTQTAARLAAYVRTYVEEGGMQVQFNVLDTSLLREAKANPGRYPTLMVRMSGYNAYFDDLDDDTKQELIDRTEHRLQA